MKDRAQDLIKQAARSFDAELHTQDYSKTHADLNQLNRLISFLPTADHQVILDLATGAGYVAMELAKRNPFTRVIGLDIAEEAIAKNIQLAEQQRLLNIRFQVFNGLTLPFEKNSFTAIFCRYALHHFPLPQTTLAEIVRTLKKPGLVIIADAVKCSADESDFINKFQVLKNDGHVKFYPTTELVRMFEQHGLILQNSFESSLSFKRESNDEYRRLIDDTSAQTLKAYNLSTTPGHIGLTLPIFNGLFVQHTAQDVDG